MVAGLIRGRVTSWGYESLGKQLELRLAVAQGMKVWGYSGHAGTRGLEGLGGSGKVGGEVSRNAWDLGGGGGKRGPREGEAGRNTGRWREGRPGVCGPGGGQSLGSWGIFFFDWRF